LLERPLVGSHTPPHRLCYCPPSSSRFGQNSGWLVKYLLPKFDLIGREGILTMDRLRCE
jgi:hypothetical protein